MDGFLFREEMIPMKWSEYLEILYFKIKPLKFEN